MAKAKRFLVHKLPAPDRPAFLDKTESEHAKNVMRLKSGDQVEAIDGEGGCVLSTLAQEGKKTFLEFLEDRSSNHLDSLPLTVVMSVIKSEPLEWLIEKCVELGVQEFVPVVSDRSVVKIKNKGPEFFQTRWKKIADQALKQCERLHRMRVHPPGDFSSWVSQSLTNEQKVLWCNEQSNGMNILEAVRSTPGQQKILLVGPEGGWSDDEISMLKDDPRFVAVSLGPLILRAETAAIFGVSVISSSLRFDT